MDNDVLNGLLQYNNDLIKELHNTSFYIVDDIMGSGKTSAAINMINYQGHKEKYIYIIPYLDEVQRIINACDMAHFKEPKNYGSKLNGLKELLKKGENIVTTHALFHLFDDEIIDMCKKQRYTLILDEATEIVSIYELTKEDKDAFLNKYTNKDAYGFLNWNYDDKDSGTIYNNKGRFNKEKKLCENHSLIVKNLNVNIKNNEKNKDKNIIFKLFPIKVFLAFKEVYILTYMFNGQLQKCYYDLFNIDYSYLYVIGNDIDDYDFEPGYKITDIKRYKYMINILEHDKLNNIGGVLKGTEILGEHNLSKTWYLKNIKSSNNQLHYNIYNYFRHITQTISNDNIWTTFKDYRSFIKGDGYTKGFVACNARGTNKFRDRHNIAYAVNIYMNPLIKRFFIDNNIQVDEDLYALSNMLQFIWRSAIRDNEAINLYIPSIRMRRLLEEWLEKG